MRAVDTNLLVRLLTRDDAKQTASAEAFLAPGAWVSHLVLVEACGVLDSVYELAAPQIATAIEMLLSHESLTLQDPEVVVAALALYRSRSASPAAWSSRSRARPVTCRWAPSTDR